MLDRALFHFFFLETFMARINLLTLSIILMDHICLIY